MRPKRPRILPSSQYPHPKKGHPLYSVSLPLLPHASFPACCASACAFCFIAWLTRLAAFCFLQTLSPVARQERGGARLHHQVASVVGHCVGIIEAINNRRERVFSLTSNNNAQHAKRHNSSRGRKRGEGEVAGLQLGAKGKHQ